MFVVYDPRTKRKIILSYCIVGIVTLAGLVFAVT